MFALGVKVKSLVQDGTPLRSEGVMIVSERFHRKETERAFHPAALLGPGRGEARHDGDLREAAERSLLRNECGYSEY